MTFDELSEQLFALEGDKHRIVKIYHPETGRLWPGLYGGAMTVEPDELGIGYVTSDGERHAL